MRKTLLLLALMLALVCGSALAQDVPPTFCGDLSEADCAILTGSDQAMKDVSSAAFNFDLNFAMSNIPTPEMDSLSFRLTGDGAYAVDSEALSALSMSPSEMMAHMDELPQLLETAIKAISADTTLVLYLPKNLPASAGRLPDKVGLSLRLVDGVGYANLDKLAELDRSGNLPKGWVGIDLAGLVKQALESQSGTFTMPGTMNMSTMGMFADPEFMKSYLTVTRGEDVTVDGQQAAVFDLSADVGALFSNPDFQKMMLDQINSAAGSSNISPSQVDRIMGMYSTLFDGFVIHVTRTISLDDHYLRQMTLNLDWALDMSSMMAAFGTPSSSTRKTDPININVTFEGNLSQFNEAPEITAPEDAQIIPLNSLFGRPGKST